MICFLGHSMIYHFQWASSRWDTITQGSFALLDTVKGLMVNELRGIGQVMSDFDQGSGCGPHQDISLANWRSSLPDSSWDISSFGIIIS